jgi:hypothetical protein
MTFCLGALYREQGVMYPPSREPTRPQCHLPYPATPSEGSLQVSDEKNEQVSSYILRPASTGLVQTVQAAAWTGNRRPRQNESLGEMT